MAGWGRCMPFAYLLRSAIDRGLRRTGVGQEETFDRAVHIVNNLSIARRAMNPGGTDIRRMTSNIETGHS